MHRLIAALALIVFGQAAFGQTTPAPASDLAEGMTFVFEQMNGTYTDLGGDVTEIQNGPLTVIPTSSSNSFELFANRLEMTPLGDGVHDAKFWVHFEGEADVEAEVRMAGLSAGRLTDEVTVLNQERTIETRIKLERQEDDYLITVVEDPKELRIQVRSRLGGQIVSMCESLTRFAFGSSCDGLDTALSNPRIPLAEKGNQFVLESGQLKPEEKVLLDAYLAASE